LQVHAIHTENLSVELGDIVEGDCACRQVGHCVSSEFDSFVIGHLTYDIFHLFFAERELLHDLVRFYPARKNCQTDRANHK
jgi:hypothetical protein